MRTLVRISITPVKGLHLVHPVVAELTPAGIAVDRRFFLVDQADELVDASDHARLLTVLPDYDPAQERLGLTFPDGLVVEGAADRLGDAVATDVFGNLAEGRRVLGPFTEALSSFVDRPIALARVDRDGTAQDSRPLTIVSTASVRDLGARGGREHLDARRFRITLEVDGVAPYEEDSWSGGLLRVGDATIRVTGQIPRCVVTTLGPDTGEKDFGTLTEIARYRPRIGGKGGLPFGMYAETVVDGTVRVGDEVEPVSSTARGDGASEVDPTPTTGVLGP